MTAINRIELDGVEIKIEPPPPYVGRGEVERMKLRFGADNPFVRDRITELTAYETWLADRTRGNDALRDNDALVAARDAKRERERAESREATRQEEADKRAAEVRSRFFRATPHAAEADFERPKQRLPDEEMPDNARGGRDGLVDEMRALRGRGEPYRM